MPRKFAILAAVAVGAALAAGFLAFTSGSFGAPSSSRDLATVATTSFLPSRDGLAFRNPVAPINGTALQKLTAEQCGGMAFAAIDYFRAGSKPPSWLSATSGLIRERSVQSILSNGWRFLLWSELPDRTRRGIWGVSDLTREREVPRLAERLQKGPVALGLVRSYHFQDVRWDHQVVAYRLRRDASLVTVSIYDPDQPGSDTVDLVLDLANKGKVIEWRDDVVVAEWRGLFVEQYVPQVDELRLP